MYYLMRYPSSWGMGSNVDIYLITEDNLKRLIVEELKRKEENVASASERYTGDWSYADFCAGRQEEIFKDIIDKRLNTCSTYARCNDLIRLPEDMPVTIKKEHMTDTIFRTFNQWHFANDVIVHDATFIRYVIDVQGYEELTGLKEGRYWEFTGYDFKGVLMNSLFPLNSVEEVIRLENNKIERYSAKLAGKKTDNHGYISDYIDVYHKWMIEEIEKSKKIVAHIQEKVSPQEDNYYEYLYKTDYGWWDEDFKESIDNDKYDHTQLTYSTLLCDTFGCIYSGYAESRLPHRYDEIFKGECNIEYLLCSATGSDDENDFGKINVFSTLVSVFGYD
jgi:hypothetical protein